MGSNQISCNFCGKPEEVVETLIASSDSDEKKRVYICDQCIEEAHSITEQKIPNHELKLLKPKEIVDKLNEFVIGQNKAKRTIAVAVYNHYKRVRALSKNPDMQYAKSNAMFLGPTGCGKTLLARTLAKIIDVPFAIADATTLTEAGYVGEDVENIILRLVQNADYDIARAEVGIIYIDEVDKLRKTSSNVSITRDVSGEGVQQALLKIVEGTIANIPPKGGRKHPNQEYIKVNTQNILFMVGGAFVHLEDIIAKRLGKSTIGFNAGQKKEHKVHDRNWLLEHVEPEDLNQFGIIPEFVGRFNSIANLNELSEEDLIRILTEPNDAIIRQYQGLFEEENVELEFTEGALRAIGKKAKESGTGARALRMSVENLLLDLMYEVPSDATVRKITITEECVTEKADPLIERSA